MIGGIETSPIITRMKFLVDDSGVNTMIEKVTQYQGIIQKLSGKITETLRPGAGKEGEDILIRTITPSIVPMKNLEDSLDTFKGSMQGSTQALVVADSEFNNLYGNLLNADEATQHTSTSMERFGKTTFITSTITNQFGDVISTNTRLMQQNQARFNMWALSIMFFGMQIQRIFGKMWTNMKDSYFKITENTTALGQANLRLSASMTFLQVSIMTALEPALLPLVETIIDLVNWFSGLPDNVKAAAGEFVIFGTAIGTLMSGAGSVTMFVSMGLIPLIAKLKGSGSVAESAQAAGWAVTGMGTSVATSSSSMLLSLGIAALAIITILEILRGGWADFEMAIKLHTLAIKYAAEQNWKEMGISLEMQNKTTIQGLLMGWSQLSVDLWNILLELGKGILKVWEWINPSTAPLVEEMIKSFTLIQQNAFIKLEQLKAKTSISVIKDTINEIGVSKELAQVLVDAGYKYNDVKSAIDQSTLSQAQATDFMKLYTETLATTLRATTDVTTATSASTNASQVRVMQIQAEIDKNNEFVKSNNAVATSINTISYAYGTTAASYSNMSEQQRVAAMTPAERSAAATQGGITGYWATHMQTGGIVTQPTLTMVGENYRPEAIIPLDRLNNMNQNSPSVNVGDINIDITTGPISSDIDMKDLANKVSDEIMKDIRNYTKYVPQW